MVLPFRHQVLFSFNSHPSIVTQTYTSWDSNNRATCHFQKGDTVPKDIVTHAARRVKCKNKEIACVMVLFSLCSPLYYYRQ